MKKSLFAFTFASIVLAMSFTSCEKEVINPENKTFYIDAYKGKISATVYKSNGEKDYVKLSDGNTVTYRIVEVDSIVFTSIENGSVFRASGALSAPMNLGESFVYYPQSF